MKNDTSFRPDRIGSYFRAEWLSLTFVTLSGLLYNVGLLAAPWFEGRLAQCLADILGGRAAAAQMAMLVLAARFIKRFYVRRFANNINRRMKGILYANLVRQSRTALEKEGAGELMTKAISDVDDCVEGMRKFTTEIFDTGVALAGYAVMLFVYDWRLALLSLLFTPVSYVCAAWMKKPVQRAGAAYKKAAGALSAATLDRAQNAVTYRICGCESAREARYEDALATYEKTAVRSNVRQSALPPLYLAVASLDKEVAAMEDSPDTVIGSRGTRLSGGQAQRLALARTLAHPRPVLVLDDPFSALDRGTEGAIFAGLQAYAKDKVVFLISHRLYHFPLLQQIIFMEDGQTTVDTHQELMVSVPVYRQLYESQAGGEQA